MYPMWKRLQFRASMSMSAGQNSAFAPGLWKNVRSPEGTLITSQKLVGAVEV